MTKIEANFRLDLMKSIVEVLGNAIMNLATLELPIEGERAKDQAILQEPVLEILGRIFHLSEDELLLVAEDQPYLLIRQYSWYRLLLSAKGEGDLVRQIETAAWIHGLLQTGSMITTCEIEELTTILLDFHQVMHEYVQAFEDELDFRRTQWQQEVRSVAVSFAPKAASATVSGAGSERAPLTMEELRAKYGERPQESEEPSVEVIVVMDSIGRNAYRFYPLAPMEDWPLLLEELPSSPEDDGAEEPKESPAIAVVAMALNESTDLVSYSITTRYIEVCVHDDADLENIKEVIGRSLFEAFASNTKYVHFVASTQLLLSPSEETEEYDLGEEDD